MGIGKSKKKKPRLIPESSSEKVEPPIRVSEIKQSGGNIKLHQEQPEIRVLDLSISGNVKTNQSSDLSNP